MAKKSYKSKSCRLLSMMSMTITFFLVEIIVGYLTNSMALVTDSFHMLSDVLSLIVGFIAVRISRRKRSAQYTYGWIRAEVIGALVNSVFLVALCFSVFVESLKRLFEIEPIENPKLILIVGAGGLLINLIGLALFHDIGHGHSHGGDSHSHSHSHSRPHPEEGHTGDGDNLTLPILPSQDSSMELILSSSQENGGSERMATTPPLAALSEITPSDKQEREVAASQDHLETIVAIPYGRSVKFLEADESVVDSEDEDEDSEETPDAAAGAAGKPKKNMGGAQLNMRAVFLHVLSDALGSVVVIISALVVWLVEADWRFYVDPAMSLVLVCLILSSSIPLLKKTASVLLQTAPSHIKIDSIDKKLAQVDGVLSVHELHVWQLTGNKIIASAHITCRNDSMEEYMKIANQVKDIFHLEGIHSTTIQPEFVNDESETDASVANECAVLCSSEEKCYEQTCCGSDQALASNSNSNSSQAALTRRGSRKQKDPSPPLETVSTV